MYITKRVLRFMTLSAMAVVGLTITLWMAVAGARTYRVEQGYPRMIYVPGCDEGPKVTAYSAVLIDQASGAVLYAKGEHIRRAPASTTKILTALLALEYGRLDETVTVSRRAAAIGGSSLWLRPGDRLALSELVKGILMRSGNDGSAAIAEHLAGSEAEFAHRMTMKARELGAINSQFRNAHGLRAVGHYSTAYDLGILARHALNNPEFARLVATQDDTLHWDQDGKSKPLHNTNRLLGYFQGADGVKTGTTFEAGKCLVASASRGDMQLIAVVLHSSDRWGEAARLLEHGFRRYELVWGAKLGQSVSTVPVRHGHTPEVRLVPRSPLCLPVPRGYRDEILRIVDAVENVKAPVRAGTVLGKVGLFLGDEEICSVDLIAASAVRRRFFWWL